jgi:uncharacterized protein (TIRG00374 family)
VGAALSVLLTGAAVSLVALKAQRMPEIVSFWPLALALGASVFSWWLQGLISALLARPHLEKLRTLDMTRVYLAGAFVGGISPVRGGEIPVEVLLLRRLGLSAAQGSTVVVTRGLLNVSVATLATAAVLIFVPELASVGSWKLLVGALGIGVVWALLALLARGVQRRRIAGRASQQVPHAEPGRWARWRAAVTAFLSDMRGTFALFLRPGHRPLLVYGAALMLLYWAVRLSFGPLALMAAGYTGGWVPVVVAQLLLVTFVLPLAPTPGGSGAAELGFTALVGAHAPEAVVLSGVIIYAGLTHYLPTVVGGLLTGRQLWRSPGRQDGF